MLITVQPNPSWQLSLAQLSPSLFYFIIILYFQDHIGSHYPLHKKILGPKRLVQKSLESFHPKLVAQALAFQLAAFSSHIMLEHCCEIHRTFMGKSFQHNFLAQARALQLVAFSSHNAALCFHLQLLWTLKVMNIVGKVMGQF